MKKTQKLQSCRSHQGLQFTYKNYLHPTIVRWCIHKRTNIQNVPIECSTDQCFSSLKPCYPSIQNRCNTNACKTEADLNIGKRSTCPSSLIWDYLDSKKEKKHFLYCQIIHASATKMQHKYMLKTEHGLTVCNPMSKNVSKHSNNTNRP